MLPREEFAAAFWRVHNTLRSATEQDMRQQQQQAGGAAAEAAGGGGAGGVVVGMPSFFTFMTLMGGWWVGSCTRGAISCPPWLAIRYGTWTAATSPVRR